MLKCWACGFSCMQASKAFVSCKISLDGRGENAFLEGMKVQFSKMLVDKDVPFVHKMRILDVRCTCDPRRWHAFFASSVVLDSSLFLVFAD